METDICIVKKTKKTGSEITVVTKSKPVKNKKLSKRGKQTFLVHPLLVQAWC